MKTLENTKSIARPRKSRVVVGSNCRGDVKVINSIDSNKMVSNNEFGNGKVGGKNNYHKTFKSKKPIKFKGF